MFILRNTESESISYYAMNKSDAKDEDVETLIDAIVDSLFSMFATLGSVPVIRSQKGNAADLIAEKLDKRLRENLRNARSNLFTTDSMHSGQISFQRPLMIILDRNLDMATPLHHTWTYQAIAHDVLDLRLNRVTVSNDDVIKRGTKSKNSSKSLELNVHDKFWMSFKGSPFRTVAESIQEELEQYKSSEDDVKQLKSSMGLDGDADAAISSMLGDTTAQLTSAMTSLPQLLEKKRLIDLHTTVATSILNNIKSRKLDIFFELEEKIMSKQALDRSLSDILSDADSGTPEDKLRLFLIYFICTNTISDADIAQYSSIIERSGCDLSSLNYLKRWKAYTKMVVQPNHVVGGGTRTVSMFTKLMSQGSSFVMEGVKNLVVKNQNLPVTRIVDDLMEQRNSLEIDDFRYFDPKQLRQTTSAFLDSSQRSSRQPFQTAIVFVVGGGNYIEYQNLVDYAKSKTQSGVERRITYGCSALNNAADFLSQLTRLGKEIG